MYTIVSKLVFGEVYHCVCENGVSVGAWHHLDLPEKFKYLLEKQYAYL